MGTVYINYENLQDSIDRADRARSEISDYIDEIKRRITTPISNLNGNDSKGYASSASSLAQQKISELNSISGKFVDYKSRVSTFISTAKTKDNHVSDKIETIADLYIEERTWYEKIGDFLYETFCVDWANDTALGRLLMDGLKWTGDKVGNLLEVASDWFKYGAGKYVLNIVGAALGAIVAVAGVVVAVITFPVTGTAAMVLAAVGLTASVVATVITVGNAGAEIASNGKALGHAANGDIGAARYYGNVDSISEYWNREDMGDAETNAKYEKIGKTIDTVKVVADTVSFATDVASLGVVKDFRFKDGYGNKGFEWSYKNIKRNILHDMGIYTSKVSNKKIKFYDKVNWKDAVDFGEWFGGYGVSKFSRDGKLVIPEALYHALNRIKAIDNTNDTLKTFVELDAALKGNESSFADYVENIAKITSVFKPIGENIGSFDDFLDAVDGWVDLFEKYDPFGLKNIA